MANQSIFITNDDEIYKIRDTSPALVLLDINLANPARGWNTFDMIRLHPKMRDIPVLLCSTDDLY